MTNQEFDVIVAGGGPAGSSTASFLRKRGRRVLVLERERFPRFHLGESLLPFARDVWEELGVLDEIDRRFIHKPGARFIHNESGETFTYYFENAIRPGRSYAYEVPRGDFDKLLLDNAAALGAVVREESEVSDLSIDGDGVRVQVREHRAGAGEPYEARAAVFVDATGRDTLLGRRYGLKESDDLVTTNVACYTQFENTTRQQGRDEGNIDIVLFDGGWWWVIPFKGTRTSVGCVLEKTFTLSRKGLSGEQLFEEARKATPVIERMLGGATRAEPIGTTGNWSYRCRQYYGDRFLLVGDSAAFIDPLFSTGVLMAVYGARFAAESIDKALTAGDFAAERFAAYQAHAVRGADLFKGLVHEFYGESLRKLLMQSADNPTMCAVITSLLAGDVYHPSIWHGVLKEGFSRLAVATQGTSG